MESSRLTETNASVPKDSGDTAKDANVTIAVEYYFAEKDPVIIVGNGKAQLTMKDTSTIPMAQMKGSIYIKTPSDIYS